MRLPGTRYQEHGWEQVRKLLGRCSLQALGRFDPALLLAPGADDALSLYVDAVARALHATGSRGEAAGNSYGDTVLELALSLVYELQARPGDWAALCAAVAGEHARNSRFWEHPGGEAQMRKKFNDMYAILRDKVDSDNYQVACGRPCSPNRMYAYRMLDTAYHEIARLFDAWSEHREQVGAILGREIDAMPIEVKQLRSRQHCRAEWVLRWSESLARFTDAAGPLHTRSKRFASLKTSPAKIDAMLREIGEYEELSANQDREWLYDAGEAGAWFDDYLRVLSESEQAATPGPDQILEALEDELALDVEQVSGAPNYIPSADVSPMADESLPVRMAVYLKLLGPFDDSYPAEWLDPATGELPTMQQLAGLEGISLPTLRKRRDAAIERLHARATEEENG